MWQLSLQLLGRYGFARFTRRPRFLLLCVMYLGILVFLTITVVYGYPSTNSSQTMQLLHVIHRHGERSIYKGTPNDPYLNESYWPDGIGQLTNKGKQQLYELGQFLAKRYSTFLHRKYHYENVYVLSTDISRTLMSVESLLAGLYPPEGSQVWNEHINWQPIPVHSVPSNMDTILYQEFLCKRYDEELQNALETPEMKAISKKYSWLYSYLTENTGANISNPVQVHDVYDDLIIEKDNNLTLPEWSKRVFPKEMEFLQAFSFIYRTYTLKMRRIRAGPLLNEIVQHLKDHRDGHMVPSRRQLFVYSAHDTNIASVLSLLDIFEPHQPPYAATILIELLVDAQRKHFIKLFYRNDTKVDPYLLTIPGCKATCPLDTFVTLTKPLVVTDLFKECQPDVM